MNPGWRVPPAGPDAVLLDTNVFVSAVKDPARQTATFRLIVNLLAREGVRFVGNDILAWECLRYAQVFPSPTAAAIASAILERMEIVRVEDRFLMACAPYFGPGNASDCVHAATCLQTGAVLVSNDRDFDPVRRAGLVEVVTITDALRRWIPSRDG